MKHFEIHHRVGLEETNVVGNVYFVHYLRWQGRCRELFLAEHAPGVLDELTADMAFCTVRCSCDFVRELRAFDEVLIRMSLKEMLQNRIRFAFEYFRANAGDGEELVARGEQEVACMRRRDSELIPAPLPPRFREALLPYQGSVSRKELHP